MRVAEWDGSVAEWDGSVAWADMGPDVVQVRISGPFGPRLLINFVITLSKVQREFSCQEMLVAPVGNIAGNVNPGLNACALDVPSRRCSALCFGGCH